ncbi:unnamed protein product [Zymoseptoria tritici ST99CH_1A5]|uniref:Uncharacterized protein n=1 Tax=Zymoseptoria tritici ST99CH_1A5 TaxID=1276529 RepID=A0A1Y6L2V2_ZYMTR|nr:unnamed protein product [Zymoseptoria tritici ST99CH_1A5]
MEENQVTPYIVRNLVSIVLFPSTPPLSYSPRKYLYLDVDLLRFPRCFLHTYSMCLFASISSFRPTNHHSFTAVASIFRTMAA